MLDHFLKSFLTYNVRFSKVFPTTLLNLYFVLINGQILNQKALLLNELSLEMNLQNNINTGFTKEMQVDKLQLCKTKINSMSISKFMVVIYRFYKACIKTNSTLILYRMTCLIPCNGAAPHILEHCAHR